MARQTQNFVHLNKFEPASRLNTDDEDGVVRAAFELLQRQFKTGLSSEVSLSMYEIGFTDREVAKRLAEAFPTASTYTAARAAIRQNIELGRASIAAFPSYFRDVLEELGGVSLALDE